MKHFSSALFTLIFAVCFYGSSGWGQSQEACAMRPNENACMDCCITIEKAQDDVQLGTAEKPKTGKAFGVVYNNCTAACKKKYDTTATLQNCKEAIKTWSESAEKNPCGGGDAKDCEVEYAKCADESSQAFGSSEEGEGEGSLGKLSGIVGKFMSPKTNQLGADGSPSKYACFTKFKISDKDVLDAKKRRKEEIKSVKKEIEEAKKEIVELDKKAKVEKNDVEKQLTKLERDTREALKKLDKDKQNDAEASLEKISSKTKNILSLQDKVMAQKKAGDRLKFEFQQRMLDYTEDKINKNCKEAVMIARDCLTKRRIEGAPSSNSPEDTTCAAVTRGGSKTGQGIKGSANLRAKLLIIRTACFERFENTTRTENYNHNDTLSNFSVAIKQFQDNIESETRDIASEKEKLNKLVVENTKNKADTTVDTEKDKTNLLTALEDLKKSTEDSINNTKAIIEDRQRQLNQLVAGKLADELDMEGDGGRTIFQDIGSSITNQTQKIQTNANIAYTACGCAKNSNAENCNLVSKDGKPTATSRRKTKKDTTKEGKIN